MTMSDEHLQSFIARYENAFGERLTTEAATELYAQLLELYRTILRVPPKEPPFPTISMTGEEESTGAASPSPTPDANLTKDVPGDGQMAAATDDIQF